MYSLLLIFATLFMIPATHATLMEQTSKRAILEAVQSNNLPVVEQLLKKGAPINTQDEGGSSLLLIATRHAQLEMARLLVAAGADVNQQNHAKDSPFLLAGAMGNTDLVNLFLAHGARFDLFNRYHGTALIPACERGHLAVVKILANTKGFPIDHINRLGWTALLEAVILGDGSQKYVEVVQILIKAGCNIHLTDADGVSALQHAKKKGFTQIVRLLDPTTKQ